MRSMAEQRAAHVKRSEAGCGGRDRSARSGERGSVSSWLITGAFVMILGVGIAVDLTGQVHTQTRANNVAFEAARAGAQQLDVDAAVSGGATGKLDQGAVRQAVAAYLGSAGMTGRVVGIREDAVTVQVDAVYETKFLSIIALSRMPVTGEGEARAVQALDGIEQ